MSQPHFINLSSTAFFATAIVCLSERGYSFALRQSQLLLHVDRHTERQLPAADERAGRSCSSACVRTYIQTDVGRSGINRLLGVGRREPTYAISCLLFHVVCCSRLTRCLSQGWGPTATTQPACLSIWTQRTSRLLMCWLFPNRTAGVTTATTVRWSARRSWHQH